MFSIFLCVLQLHYKFLKITRFLWLVLLLLLLCCCFFILSYTLTAFIAKHLHFNSCLFFFFVSCKFYFLLFFFVGKCKNSVLPNGVGVISVCLLGKMPINFLLCLADVIVMIYII